jgi:aspartyl-tRNA(Asn)/glutamyl-tRNA(Gln) amidotransferase subunit C
MSEARTITREQVRHVAVLARLNLSDDEIDRFTRELAAILAYVDQLQEVDVHGVEPTAHAVAIQNVLRADEVQGSFNPDEALAIAPKRDGSFFQVPKVLD